MADNLVVATLVGFTLSQRLLSELVKQRVLRDEDARRILDSLINGHLADPNSTNEAVAQFFRQLRKEYEGPTTRPN